MHFLNNKKLILASKSPRRKELMEKAQFKFELRIREVEEIYPPTLNIKEIPKYLAELKSSIFTDLQHDEILISADTMVLMKDRIMGKPKDKDDAIETLSTLQNNTHQVITGVCFKTHNKLHVFDQETTVELYPMSREEITYYVEEFMPFDKAGSYGIQDWIGLCKVKALHGSYTNVMGLPMGKLYHELVEFIK